MTAAVVAVGRRYLPRGWSHFWLQVGIWFGFLGVYQLVRGMADKDSARAFQVDLRRFRRRIGVAVKKTKQRFTRADSEIGHVAWIDFETVGVLCTGSVTPTPKV